MNKDFFYVYKTEIIKGKYKGFFYIGSCVNKNSKRNFEKYYGSNSFIKNFIEENGCDFIQKEILFESSNKSDILKKEREIALKYWNKTPFLINRQLPVGIYVDRQKIWTKEKREEYSKYKKEYYKKHPQKKGVFHHNENSKILISEVSKRNWKNEEYRIKVLPNLEKSRGENLSKRISKQNLGRFWWTDGKLNKFQKECPGSRWKRGMTKCH